MTADEGFTPPEEPNDPRQDVLLPDGQRYVPYHYDDAGEIVLHVRIALATGRPLLLEGWGNPAKWNSLGLWSIGLLIMTATFELLAFLYLL
jgi:hypothetical protein